MWPINHQPFTAARRSVFSAYVARQAPSFGAADAAALGDGDGGAGNGGDGAVTGAHLAHLAIGTHLIFSW